MALAPVHEKWLIDVHDALAGVRGVPLGQLVPGEEGYELVLTGRRSPPSAELAEELGRVLGPLLAREDSPLLAPAGGNGAAAATFHWYPALDERERELFRSLDWAQAVVVHELVD